MVRKCLSDRFAWILLKWLAKAVRCLPTQLYFGWLEKWNEQYRRGVPLLERGPSVMLSPLQEGGPAAVLPPTLLDRRRAGLLGWRPAGLPAAGALVNGAPSAPPSRKPGAPVCVCTGHHILRTSWYLRVWSLVWSTVIAQCAKWSVQLSGGDLCLVRVRCDVAGAGRRDPCQSGQQFFRDAVIIRKATKPSREGPGGDKPPLHLRFRSGGYPPSS